MTQPFRIEHKDCFRVIGYVVSTTNQKKEGTKAIPAFLNQKQDVIEKRLLPLMGQEQPGILGISIYNTDAADARLFNYMIAVASDAPLIQGEVAYDVPKAMWAIFPCTRETMAKTEVMAIMKWLPKCGYVPLNRGYITGKMKSEAPDIEYYGEGLEAEVWVAVRKK